MGLLIDMINVGQGDSFLISIEGPQGERHVLIDAGIASEGATVLDYINSHAPVGLDLVIATHIDNDHIGGLETVLRYAKFTNGAEFALNVPPAIKSRWTPIRKDLQQFRTVRSFDRLIDAVDSIQNLCDIANQRGLISTDALQGRYWVYGGAQLTVLNPTAARLAAAWEESRLDAYIRAGWDREFVSIMESISEAPSTSAENDSSVVIEISYNGVPQALMTSDAGAAVLKEVTQGKRYPLIKVPHHGSKTGLDKELVKQLNPSYAFLPVGQNDFGHPCAEILDMLRDCGTKTYCATKTKDCRRECIFKGGNVSWPIGRTHREGWNSIDMTLCRNNQLPTKAKSI
jgi:competence protein ComEC